MNDNNTIDLTKTNDDIPNSNFIDCNLQKVDGIEMQNGDVSFEEDNWFDVDSCSFSMDLSGSDSEISLDSYNSLNARAKVDWPGLSTPEIDMMWSDDNDF